MNKTALNNSIEQKTLFTFSRSSGAGGQNVNKVNTKVHAAIEIKLLEGLTESELLQLQQKLKNQINSNGFLTIDVQEEREQNLNRQLALFRLKQKIESAVQIPKKRRKTKATFASKERRLKAKKVRSEIKKLRGKLP